MEDYIPISELNDFIFCPYSIYLHNVYMETEEDVYHALPQVRGKNSHNIIDSKKTTTKVDIIESLPVMSTSFGIYGKIDVYDKETQILYERKYELKQIFKGQIYQLWSQYYAMVEMGYEVQRLEFRELSKRRIIDVRLPTEEDRIELLEFIEKFKNYKPNDTININMNKCEHCIYCNLCDKIELSNVYDE